MRSAARFGIILVLATLLVGASAATPGKASSGPAPVMQSALLAMVSPTACPSSGCAAGQRFNMRFDFEPINYDASLNPNVKVCIYAPTSWKVDTATVTVAGQGEITQKPYTDEGLVCTQDQAKPTGYDLIAGRVAQLDANTFVDALGFGFRMGATGTGSGRILARLFARSAPGTWALVQQATSTPTLTAVAPTSSLYVANDPATCGGSGPCYVNSAEDLSGGIGTGLKDAVDAASPGSTVSILGTYTIKSNTVIVNQAIRLTGLNGSSLTNNQPGSCNSAMLSLTGAVTLNNLNILDTTCPDPGRDLVDVNSPDPVAIERNDLHGGGNAIFVRDNTGPVTVRFNNITNNHGYAVYAEGNANGAAMEITANNLYNDRSGPAVDCSASASGPISNRKANHNYWGPSSPTSAESHCAIAAGKRLGMPIAAETNQPGARVRLVQVTDAKIYNDDLGQQIAYNRTGGSNFNLYIVDHGYATAGGPPFTYTMGGESPSPCSNYWDVFLPDGEAGSGILELYFKYDKTAGCLATINSNQYCDQTTTMASYPLYWFDPNTGVTKWWDPTGARPENLSSGEGQPTSCNIANNEIHVSIDNTGRPNLADDLQYAPFMVGVPVIKSFLPLASSQMITITWTTNNEPDINGFYVLRGTDSSHLSPISDLIAHTGNALTGRSYYFLDSGRTNGVTYFYRLQVLRTDGTSFYSTTYSVAANVATITPTPTITPTRTATRPIPTSTPYPTLIPTQIPTRIPTATFIFKTPTPGSTALVLSTLTPPVDTRTPGAVFTLTSIANTQAVAATQRFARLLGTVVPGAGTAYPPSLGTLSPATETAIAATGDLTTTPENGLTANGSSAEAQANHTNSWLSLFLGLLAGLVFTGGAGGIWYYLRTRK